MFQANNNCYNTKLQVPVPKPRFEEESSTGKTVLRDYRHKGPANSAKQDSPCLQGTAKRPSFRTHCKIECVHHTLMLETGHPLNIISMSLL
jgi:hypothetical protein